MKSLGTFIKNNARIIVTIYIVSSLFTIILLTRRIILHECQRTQIEINEELKTKIEKIDDAETRHDIDSLLLELYGFESVD